MIFGFCWFALWFAMPLGHSVAGRNHGEKTSKTVADQRTSRAAVAAPGFARRSNDFSATRTTGRRFAVDVALQASFILIGVDHFERPVASLIAVGARTPNGSPLLRTGPRHAPVVSIVVC